MCVCVLLTEVEVSTDWLHNGNTIFLDCEFSGVRVRQADLLALS